MAKKRETEQPNNMEVESVEQPQDVGMEMSESPGEIETGMEGLSDGGGTSQPPSGGAGKTKSFGRKAKGVDRHYRRMELSSKFWNKVDPANRFRHWYLGAASLTRSLFRVAAAWQTVLILISILVVCYILAAFYTGKGEFVVKVDRPMADEGFLISETPDFSELLVTLRNDAVEDVTNISLEDIPRDVMDIDGKHNGENYIAYTFYLKNRTGEDRDYRYKLSLNTSSNNAETATWIMLFQNGKQKIYAQENKGGYPECMYRNWDIPFTQYAADPDYMNSTVSDVSQVHIAQELIDMYDLGSLSGAHELKTVPWESDDMVCIGTREGMKHDEVDKYTIVVWLEGDDPDCTDELWGGHVELRMLFTY